MIGYMHAFCGAVHGLGSLDELGMGEIPVDLGFQVGTGDRDARPAIVSLLV